MTDAFDTEIAELESACCSDDVLARARAVDRAAELITVIDRIGVPGSESQVARLRLARARMLPGLGHLREAIGELTTVVAGHPLEAIGAIALLERARLVHADGDTEAADADLTTLIGGYSDSADAAAVRIVAGAHMTRVDWAVAAAEAAEQPDAEQRWMHVAHVAEPLITGDTRGDEFVEVLAARALHSAGAAWRAIAVAEDADGDVSDADGEASRLADELFSRFAHTQSAEIRALVVESETHLEDLTSTLDPTRALSVTERDLDLGGRWGGRPAAFFAAAALRRARALADLRRDQEAHDQLRAIVERARDIDDDIDGDIDVQLVVASAWDDLVRLLNDTDHHDAATIETARFAEWLDRRPGLTAQTRTRNALARALQTGIGILESRIEAPETEEPSIDGSAVDPSSTARESVPLTDAEADYAKAVDDFAARFASDDEASLRFAAARALQRLAAHQRLRGHYAQAEAVYRDLIGRFDDDPSTAIRDDVLGPSELNLGFLLLSILARPADAVAVYDDAIARIGEPRTRSARSLLGRLQASRATAMTDVYDRGDAHVASERTDGAHSDPIGADERERIRAAIARGRAASDAADHVAAIDEYNSIIDAHPTPVGRELRQRVCDAMVRKGYSLGQLKRWHDSVAHHHTMLALFDDDIDTTVEKDIALALSNLANAFDQLDRHEEEIDAYERILTRWSDSPVPELIGRCARAAWLKGFTESELGRTDDAERSYRRGMRHLAAEETATRVNACKSAVNLAIFLRRRGRAGEAAAAASQAIAALTGVAGASAAEQRTKAHMAHARAEAEGANTAAALDSYDWLLDDRGSTITDEQRRRLTQERIDLLGGPFKAAWHRLRRNGAGR